MTIIRIVDFETTGVEPPAQVCEVGICDLYLEDKIVKDPYAWICKVSSMPPEVRAIHHISLEECLSSEKEFDQNDVFGEKISAYAAHNADFEMKFFSPNAPMICTYKSALRIWPDAPSHSNGALRYWLQEQEKISLNHNLTQPSHRAGPDAYVTAHLLLAIFNEGITGKQMVAWTKEPKLLPKCPIGKFKGLPWSEVEAGFLGWMLRQPDMEQDLKWNAQREISRRQA